MLLVFASHLETRMPAGALSFLFLVSSLIAMSAARLALWALRVGSVFF